MVLLIAILKTKCIAINIYIFICLIYMVLHIHVISYGDMYRYVSIYGEKDLLSSRNPTPKP